MRSVISESVVRATFRLTAVSVLALTVAACSTDTTRFSQPMFSSANDYTGSITPKEGVGYGGARAPGTIASNADIQQAPLAAPGSYPSQPYPSQPYPQTSGGYGQGSGYTPPASQPIYSQPTYGQGQSTYSQPAYGAQPGSYQAGANVHAPTVMPDGSPGAVSSVRPSASATPHSGITVAVERGETLYSISRRYGVPVNALMQANGISDPTSVRVGQRLNIPQYSATKSGWVTGPQPVATRAVAPEPRAASRVATATKVDRAPTPAPKPAVHRTTSPAPSASGGTHTVASGETLYSISRRYGVSVSALQQQNGIASPSHLRVGQRLSIPGAGSTAAVINTKPQPAVARAPQPAPVQQAAVKHEPAPPATPAQVVEDKPVSTAAIPAPQAINEGFRWPARGRVISAFGEANNGSTNEGINIAVPEGTSIRAAENGVVIYSGSELEGLGNLVLVRHSDNWVTAYAHARDLRVKRGDKVTRGQVIATAGQTGKVKSPQLHFELRKGSKPVDPLRYLSAL